MYYQQNLYHVVKQKDTIYWLAKMYDTTVEDIMSHNPGINPNNLKIGSRILIRPGNGWGQQGGTQRPGQNGPTLGNTDSGQPGHNHPLPVYPFPGRPDTGPGSVPPVNNRPGSAPVNNRPGSVPPVNNRPGSAPVNNRPGSAPVNNRPGSVPPVNNRPGSAPVNNRPVSTPAGSRPGSAPSPKNRPGGTMPIPSVPLQSNGQVITDQSVAIQTEENQPVVNRIINDVGVHAPIMYDQSTYDGTVYDPSAYDQTAYDPLMYDQTAYDPPMYDQTAYDPLMYDQMPGDSSLYDQDIYTSPEYSPGQDQPMYGSGNYDVCPPIGYIPPASDDYGPPECDPLHDDMRQVWQEHVFGTRFLLISVADRLEDTEAVKERLMQNPQKIAAVFAPYFSEEAVSKVSDLLTEHLQTGGDIMIALRDKKTGRAEELNKQWKANAAKLADGLYTMNPNYEKDILQQMLNEHLKLTSEEVAARLDRNYSEDGKAFDRVLLSIQEMADYLSDGIVQQ